MNVITFRFGKKLNDWVNTLPEKTIWMLKAENMLSAYTTDLSGVFLFIQWGAYGANTRTSRMILLLGNITDNLFVQ